MPPHIEAPNPDQDEGPHSVRMLVGCPHCRKNVKVRVIIQHPDSDEENDVESVSSSSARNRRKRRKKSREKLTDEGLSTGDISETNQEEISISNDNQSDVTEPKSDIQVEPNHSVVKDAKVVAKEEVKPEVIEDDVEEIYIKDEPFDPTDNSIESTLSFVSAHERQMGNEPIQMLPQTDDQSYENESEIFDPMSQNSFQGFQPQMPQRKNFSQMPRQFGSPRMKRPDGRGMLMGAARRRFPAGQSPQRMMHRPQAAMGAPRKSPGRPNMGGTFQGQMPYNVNRPLQNTAPPQAPVPPMLEEQGAIDLEEEPPDMGMSLSHAQQDVYVPDPGQQMEDMEFGANEMSDMSADMGEGSNAGPFAGDDPEVFKEKVFNGYKCTICGKIMGDPSNLRRHIAGVHLKLKPHSCAYCGKRFGRKEESVVHRAKCTMTGYPQTFLRH